MIFPINGIESIRIIHPCNEFAESANLPNWQAVTERAEAGQVVIGTYTAGIKSMFGFYSFTEQVRKNNLLSWVDDLGRTHVYAKANEPNYVKRARGTWTNGHLPLYSVSSAADE